jgi:hypothetical protein
MYSNRVIKNIGLIVNVGIHLIVHCTVCRVVDGVHIAHIINYVITKNVKCVLTIHSLHTRNHSTGVYKTKHCHDKCRAVVIKNIYLIVKSVSISLA